MNDFGDMTPRIKSFRDELLKIEPKVCAERARLATKAYREHESDQIILKRAYMLKEVLENMSIYIEPQTLIVGNQASENRRRPSFPNMRWIGWCKSWTNSKNARATDSRSARKTNRRCARSIPIGKAALCRIRATPRIPKAPARSTISALSATRETSLRATRTSRSIMQAS